MFYAAPANRANECASPEAGVCANVKLNDVLAGIDGLAKHLLPPVRKRPAWSVAGAQLRAKLARRFDSFPHLQQPAKNIMRIFFFPFCLLVRDMSTLLATRKITYKRGGSGVPSRAGSPGEIILSQPQVWCLLTVCKGRCRWKVPREQVIHSRRGRAHCVLSSLEPRHRGCLLSPTCSPTDLCTDGIKALLPSSPHFPLLPASAPTLALASFLPRASCTSSLLLGSSLGKIPGQKFTPSPSSATCLRSKGQGWEQLISALWEEHSSASSSSQSIHSRASWHLKDRATLN